MRAYTYTYIYIDAQRRRHFRSEDATSTKRSRKFFQRFDNFGNLRMWNKTYMFSMTPDTNATIGGIKVEDECNMLNAIKTYFFSGRVVPQLKFRLNIRQPFVSVGRHVGTVLHGISCVVSLQARSWIFATFTGYLSQVGWFLLRETSVQSLENWSISFWASHHDVALRSEVISSWSFSSFCLALSCTRHNWHQCSSPLAALRLWGSKSQILDRNVELNLTTL